MPGLSSAIRLNAIYLLPVNLYGPRDNFHPHSSHVIPGTDSQVRRSARQERTAAFPHGEPARRRGEFLYVEDCADGFVQRDGTLRQLPNR